MRVCDIDGKSQVEMEFVLHTPHLGGDDGYEEVWRIEVSGEAAKALLAKDWTTLAKLVPKERKPRSDTGKPRKAAGAKAAAVKAAVPSEEPF